MKKLKITLMFCLSMIAFTSKSQNIKTFEIIGSPANISVYESAIADANMESYRNKTTRDTLVFETGVKVVFYSAQELFLKGYSINPSEYTDVRDPRYTNPTLRLIIPNGMPQAPGQKPYLVALYNHIEK